MALRHHILKCDDAGGLGFSWRTPADDWFTPAPTVFTYKCCNGHINNRHWSVYCDNGVHAHPLPSSPEPCTANGNMPQQRQTPYQGTGTAYYMFHTTAYAPLSSHDADGNYLFYFR